MPAAIQKVRNWLWLPRFFFLPAIGECWISNCLSRAARCWPMPTPKSQFPRIICHDARHNSMRSNIEDSLIIPYFL